MNKLDQIKSPARKLMEIKTVFPFTPFPDSVVIDEDKVIIVERFFFWTKRVFPLLIRDLITVTVNSGPFFATLTFEFKGYEYNPDPVRYLKKTEAEKARRLITGLTVLQRDKVDLSPFSTVEIISKAEEVGMSRP